MCVQICCGQTRTFPHTPSLSLLYIPCLPIPFSVCWSLRWVSTTRGEFHRAAKHKNLLSMKSLPWYNQDYQPKLHVLHNVFSWCLLKINSENQVGIWLVILFLSRQKFHAKQIFVLSSSMKSGPVLLQTITIQHAQKRFIHGKPKLGKRVILISSLELSRLPITTVLPAIFF